MKGRSITVDDPAGGKTQHTLPTLKHRAREWINRLNLSIRTKILLLLGIVIILMGLTNLVVVVQMLNYSRQYDAIINNITIANSISGSIKSEIDNEMWNIVAGKITFDEGRQYQIIADTNTKLLWMMDNTDSPRARIKLDVVLRAMQTLTEDVDAMGKKIANHSSATENEAMLERIRFVSGVVEKDVQDYTLFEVNRTNGQYQEMRATFITREAQAVGITVIAILFSIAAAWWLSRSIYTPIKKLHDVTKTITQNDLQALVDSNNVDEITEMGMSFNIMIGKIRDLLDDKIREQEDLRKAELKALQSQINPHFLYNTLDTIIWMAEARKTDQIVEVVSALSNFFRISLSKGQDWITIGEEIDRIQSYLTIQKMRYCDILDYRIEMDEGVAGHTVLKLILQPLVENALYHGIKNKRGGGTIVVRAKFYQANAVLLEVEDDGIGIPPAELGALQKEMAGDAGACSREGGYGLGNVNQRIRLYYGKQYGLSIRSELQIGTCVSFAIPLLKEDSLSNPRLASNAV